MSAGLRIFQVGGMSLPFPKQTVTDTYGNDSQGKFTDFLSSMSPLVKDSQYLQKPRKIKASFLAVDMRFFHFEKADQYLRSIVGKPVPIIGYVVHGNESSMYSCDCGCYDSRGCCLTFIQSIGVVTDVGELKEKDWSEPRQFDMSIELITWWRGLDTLKWRYNATVSSTTVVAIPPSEDTFLGDEDQYPPSCEIFFANCNNCKGSFVPIVYNDCKYLYDPYYLEKRLGNSCCNSPKCCVGKSGFVVEGANMGVAYEPRMNYDYWTAPPLSIYVLSGITGNKAYINIKGTDSRLMPVRRSTKIDFEITNQILQANGYDILQETDIVVIGDFTFDKGDKILRNGMIIRDEEPLDIQPIMSYPDYFPAMLTPSFDAQVEIIGNIQSASMAHYFRRM